MQNNNSDLLLTYITRGIQIEVENEFDILKKKMVEDLEKRKNEICAGIVLSVVRSIQFQTMNENIIITIKKINEQL